MAKKVVFIEFCKAQVTSIISTVIDFLVTAGLFQFLHVHYGISTTCGAIIGATMSCYLNCKWTFKYDATSKVSLAFKYAWVWLVSITLNSGITTLIVHYAASQNGAHLGSFMFIKMLVAITIAFTWNFPMHKFYVYKK